MLAVETIRAAQNNELGAIAEVFEATEPTIQRLAGRASQRMGQSGYARYAEEFAQVGRTTLWEALGRFAGSNESEFFGFVIKTIESALYDAVRSEKNGGAGIDKDAVWVFHQMLAKADGDPYRAAKLAQTEPKPGDRLSADRADAARLAYQGAAALDAPLPQMAGTLADTLTDEVDAHWAALEVLPKVGHGAALEALAVLERYAGITVQRSTPRMFAANLPTLVDLLEETVVVPREASARRYVLDAMAILRSAVSTAGEGDLIEELRGEADERADERAAKVTKVHAVLGKLGALQRDVLMMSYGIGGASCYGAGKDGDTAGLAEALGKTVQQITDARRKARQAFAKGYAALHGIARAAVLLDAFAAMNRKRG